MEQDLNAAVMPETFVYATEPAPEGQRSMSAMERTAKMRQMFIDLHSDTPDPAIVDQSVSEYASRIPGQNLQSIHQNTNMRLAENVNQGIQEIKADPTKATPDVIKNLGRASQLAELQADPGYRPEEHMGFAAKVAAATAAPADGLTTQESKVLKSQQTIEITKSIKGQPLLTDAEIEQMYPSQDWRSTLGGLLTALTPVEGGLVGFAETREILNGLGQVLGVQAKETDGIGDLIGKARAWVYEADTKEEQISRLDQIAERLGKSLSKNRILSNAASTGSLGQATGIDYDPNAFALEFVGIIARPEVDIFGIESDTFLSEAMGIGNAATLFGVGSAATKVFKFFRPDVVDSAVTRGLTKLPQLDQTVKPATYDQLKGVQPLAQIKPKGFGHISKDDDQFAAVVAKAKAQSDKVVAIQGATGLYDAAIRSKVQERTLAEIKDAVGATVRTDLTEIVETDAAGFSYRTVYGHTDKAGFADITEATKFIDTLDIDPSAVTIMRRDFETGDMVPVNNLMQEVENTGAGEYFVTSTIRRDYIPEDMKYFGSSPVIRTSSLLDPASKIAGRIMTGISDVLNQKGRISNEMNKILKDNFLKMSRKETNHVNSLLEKGDLEGRVFTTNEIRAMLGKDATPRLIAGYIEARAFFDTQYKMANRQLHNILKREGYNKQFTSDKVTFIGRERSVDDVEDNGQMFFDAESGAIKTVADVKADVAAGKGKIFTARTPVLSDKGDAYTNFYVPNNATKTRTSGLPQYVLNYNVGQVTRVYNENYFVRVVEESKVNGVTTVNQEGTVKYAAQTAKEAERYADELRKKLPKTEWDRVKVGRDEKARRALLENADETVDLGGALFLSGRGSRLARPENGGFAQILDPIDAMNLARDVSANRATFQEAYQGLEEVGISSYPEYLARSPEGVFYLKPGIKGDAQYEQAKTLYEWIDTMKKSDTTALQVKQKLLDIAEKLENLGLDKAAAKVASQEGKDPIAVTRGLGFMMQVASSPPRQLLLNATQALMLFGRAPLAATKGVLLDGWAVHMGMLLKDKELAYGLYSNTIGRAVGGLSKKEFDNLVNAYETSGLPFTVDSHAFLKGEIFQPGKVVTNNTALGRTAGAVKSAAKTAVMAPTAGVFRAGEVSNYASTFAVARALLKRERPDLDLTSEEGARAIGAKARSLFVDMSKINETPLESGAASLLLQYVSFLHKSGTMLLASTRSTPGQKFAMGAGVAAMYGMGNGYADGLAETVMASVGMDYAQIEKDWGSTVATDVKNAIEGGIMDFTFNSILRGAFGEDSTVRMSLSASPYFGIVETMHNIFGGGVFGEDGSIVFTPAVGGALGQIGTVLKEVQIASQRPDLSTSESVAEALSVLPKVLTGYSRFHKAQLGMEVQAKVDAVGNPTLDANMQSLWSQGVFGFKDANEAEAFILAQDKKDLDKARKETAQAYQKQILEMWRAYGDNPEKGLERVDYLRMQLIRTAGDDRETIAIINEAYKGILPSITRRALGEKGVTDKGDKAGQAFRSFITGINKGQLPVGYFDRLKATEYYRSLPVEQQQAIEDIERSMLVDDEGETE